MYILLPVLGITIAAIIISSVSVRNFLAQVYYEVAATWNNNTPTLRWILIALIVIIILVFFLGASWVGFWTMVGSWALSPIAGLIFGIGSLVGIFFFRGFLQPVAVLALFVVIFGFCFPILKGAFNRYGDKGEIALANKIDEKAIQLQPAGTSPAILIETAVLYDDNGIPMSMQAAKGTRVKTVSLEGRQFLGGPETFVKVMLPNIHGDFVGGSLGWISVDKVRLGATVSTDSPIPKTIPAPAKKTVAKTAVAQTQPQMARPAQTRQESPPPAMPQTSISDWNMCLDIGCFPGIMEKTGNRILITQKFWDGKVIFQGTQTGDTVSGIWEKSPIQKGEFQLTFSSTQSATGWETAGTDKLRFWINRI